MRQSESPVARLNEDWVWTEPVAKWYCSSFALQKKKNIVPLYRKYCYVALTVSHHHQQNAMTSVDSIGFNASFNGIYLTSINSYAIYILCITLRLMKYCFKKTYVDTKNVMWLEGNGREPHLKKLKCSHRRVGDIISNGSIGPRDD